MQLVWDEIGKRTYETGVSQVALFPVDTNGAYTNGVAWNGVTGITESPTGAEETALYADNIKYLALRSVEEFGATITAYSYPDEWAQCDGSADISNGVHIGQQARKRFGLVYKTIEGNDTDGNDHGYKIHIIYGGTASPAERAYATVNDSPEAIEFSWEVTTTPVNVKGFKPTSCVTIDSTKVDAAKLKSLEEMIYGSAEKEPKLPLPDEIVTIFGATTSEG